jgi:hypothetical protein
VGDFLYVNPDTFDNAEPLSSEEDEEDADAAASDEEAADKDKVYKQLMEATAELAYRILTYRITLFRPKTRLSFLNGHHGCVFKLP